MRIGSWLPPLRRIVADLSPRVNSATIGVASSKYRRAPAYELFLTYCWHEPQSRHGAYAHREPAPHSEPALSTARGLEAMAGVHGAAPHTRARDRATGTRRKREGWVPAAVTLASTAEAPRASRRRSTACPGVTRRSAFSSPSGGKRYWYFIPTRMRSRGGLYRMSAHHARARCIEHRRLTAFACRSQTR
jgi:hypothetical protein